jgi:hypothetical protein
VTWSVHKSLLSPQSHNSAYDFTGFWFYHLWWNTRYHRNFCLASLTMYTILVRVTRSLVLYVCFLDRCLSFHTFSFNHFVLLCTLLGRLNRNFDDNVYFIKSDKIKTLWNHRQNYDFVEIVSFCEQTRSLHIIPRICVCSIVRDNVTVVYVQH